jgi:hypothetical protein
MKLITEEAQDVKMLTESVKGGKKNLYIEGVFCQAETKNRNGRVYPIQTLNNAVNYYIENFVKKNRAVGELNHPCLSATAKLLSVKDSWKYIKECAEGEEVYTLNPETKSIEIHPVNKVVINPHKGIMYNLKNKEIDTKITPDHRFLIYNSKNNLEYKFVTAQEIYDDLNLDNLLSEWFIPKTSFGLNKTTPDKYTIEKTDLSIDFNTFSAFLGIFISKGLVDESNVSHIIVDKNEKDVNEILNSMEGLKWNKTSYDTIEIWSCSDSRLGEFLRDPEKRIPRDFIGSLNYHSAIIFIDHFTVPSNEQNILWDSLIDDISHIAIIAGLSVKKSQGIISDQYIFSTSQAVYLDKSSLEMTQENWDDDVYCIQVQNSNFMVEDNGYTYWTGNCSPTINYDRVSHKIISLVKEGNDFIGKALVVNTPMGNIVKNLHEEGIVFGVSSRAVGSLRSTNEGVNIVGDDLMFSTVADIVHDPSCTSAFVDGIMEGKEWYYDVTKREWLLESTKKTINKLVDSHQLEEKKLELFNSFLNSI